MSDEIDLTDEAIEEFLRDKPNEPATQQKTSKRRRAPKKPTLTADVTDPYRSGAIEYDEPLPFRTGIIEFAEYLAEHITGRFRWSPGAEWCRWTGSHWAPASDAELSPEIRDTIASRAAEVILREGPSAGLKSLQAISSTSGVAGIVKQARGLPGIFTRDEEFDRPRHPGRPDDPHLFPCKNGVTIELYDSGEWNVRDSSPNDLLTKVGCEYNPEADAPYVWERFAEYQPDMEVRQFLMRIMAGTLRGVQIQNLFVWFGEGAGNGKGTMETLFATVMGGYARTIPVHALMRAGRGSSGNEFRDELSQLKGARLVLTDEPEDGARFAAGTVSQLTGGTEMSARGIRKAAVTFVPTWTLVMATNKRPQWADHSGLDRRYCEIAWDFIIPRDSFDDKVKERMCAEAPGVLNYLLKHWPDFCKRGIAIPGSVKKQTEIGKAASDNIGRFVAECIMPSVSENTLSTEIYQAYERWCEEQGEKSVASQTRVTLRMKKEPFNYETGLIGSARLKGFLNVALCLPGE